MKPAMLVGYYTTYLQSCELSLPVAAIYIVGDRRMTVSGSITRCRAGYRVTIKGQVHSV